VSPGRPPEEGRREAVEAEEVVELPIDGILDLHQFRPGDARDVVGDYLDACREKGVLDVRIVHGKGKGVLRRIVHSLLEKRADVVSYRLAADGGGWGATQVRLTAPGREIDGIAPPEARRKKEGDGGGGGGGGRSLLRSVLVSLLLLLPLAAACGGGTGGDGAPQALILPDAEEGPEVVSLIGVPLFRPLLADARRAELEANLAAAAATYAENPGDEEAIIWYGRRLGYLSRYHDAIEVYTHGLEQHPDSYKLLRHRGHRYISTRQFDDAVADLTRAAELAAGETVEIEPDGAPNALGIPLSNVHFNIWYHLGLAHYLRGDFAAARDAYVECLQYSDNDDLLVATSDWLYMTYRRLGDDAAAQALLDPVSADMEIVENDSYHRRLLMYKGELEAEELLDLRAEADPDVALDIATQGYGVGNWYLVNGDAQGAREVFERILEGTSWAAFGYIAAEAEVARGVEGS
jgi:tetratricopeptide (TPR) repeat protein